MMKYAAVGVGLGFAAAVQPGPFQAYLFSRVSSIGWRRTLPAALAPLVSDGPIALVALLVLGRLPPPVQSILRTAGGALLLWLAARAFLQWRRGGEPAGRPGAIPRTLVEAVAVNILNPNPYLGWTLVLGPAVLAAWREAPARGITVIVAFYATLTAMIVATIVAFGATRLLGPRLRRSLLATSAVVLAALGVYQLSVGIRFFMGI